MSIRVSVILPVYNCEKYLEKSIRSVIEQTAFDLLELILVDDGSSDSSAAICDKYAEKFENISVFHQSNQGVSEARNQGIRRSKGEYIAFLDSDDMYEKDYICRMLEHAEHDIVCCDYYTEKKDEKILGKLFEKNIFEVFDNSFYEKITDSRFYSCWNKLFKKSIIKDCNLSFPLGVKYAEDMAFVFEYLKHCKSFYFIASPLYFYNVNPENTTSVVKNGYDVQKFIYEFQLSFFDGNDDLIKKVTSDFVYKTVCTINSENTYSGFFDACKYTKKVLYDSFFYERFLAENYTDFNCTYDKVLFTLLKKRMVVSTVLWRKFFDLRSKIHA